MATYAVEDKEEMLVKKRVLLVIVCALASLALSATASGATGVRFGITEDVGAMTDPNLFYGSLTELGASENRIAISWDASNPTTIGGREGLDFWVPQAALHGVRVVFAVSPLRPTDITAGPGRIGQFTDFLRQLVAAYPYVTDYVIGNEPNQPRFWQPQFNARGVGLSGRQYEPLLAASYDALKSANSAINVIGVGLSPRGNDNPFARSNVSTSPVRFLHDVGVTYRASKRTKPIMDELGFHPYPNQNNDAPLKGYPWPKAGFPNLDRLKQAVWDAFNGTAQPVFGERGKARPANALKLDLDETGWQVSIPPSLQNFYTGKENVTPVDEVTQSIYYADIVRFVSCDPDVRALSFFHLVDEENLDRWQSGLIRRDNSRRPAYSAVKNTIAQTQGRCAIAAPGWAHTTTVVGGTVAFGRITTKSWSNKRWRFQASAQEDATYKAGVFRLGSGKVTPTARRAITRTLLSGRSKPLLGATGKAPAYKLKLVVLPKKTLKRAGWYVYGIRLSAVMNPKRTLVSLSKPFRVLSRR